MTRRSRWLALPAGIALGLALATTAFAYVTQVVHTITVTPSSNTFTCGVSHVVRAQVLDLDGLPIKHLVITWSFGSSPSTLDVVQPGTSRTNAHGIATTHVKLACVLGDRTINATADGITSSAIVHVSIPDSGQHVKGITGTPGGTPGLPNTSTSPIDASSDGQPNPAVPAIIVVLAIVALIVRRFAFARR